jgi:multimeric flavodoxin WrbA
MQVIAINGSARKQGNTAVLLQAALDEIAAAGIETEMAELGAAPIQGCIACYKCKERLNRRCAVEHDGLNDLLEKILAADGLLIGSPTYFADVSSNVKSVMDRVGMVCRANGDLLARKAGAAVVAARRAGSIHAFDTINHFFLIGQMIVPGSSYWNVGFGGKPGDCSGDTEAVATMRTLGRNMAWLLGRIQG